MARGGDLADILKGVAVGAAVMYLADPRMGRRRRAMVLDGMQGLANDLRDGLDEALRDAGNRLTGVAAELRAMFTEQAISEAQLVERVRSRLGRHASHPSSIEVSAAGGQVTLRGPVRADERDGILRGVAAVRGVTEVVNRLEPHAAGADIPGLQGGTGRTGERADLMQERWAPATRLVAGVIGGSLLAHGLHRPTVPNLIAGTLGFGLLARAASNLETRRLLGVGRGRRGIDLHKTITIDAPLDRVYATWTAYANFPYFMRYVREVRDLGGGRSAWTVAGPLGTPLRFNARVTQQQPNAVFAWKTEEGEAIAHAGIVRFQRSPDGRTTVDIRMTYNPPAGAAGHIVASLFGADPRTEMDEDLARMKTFLETGRLPRDAAVRATP
jgi:uncharacterized membrane protein